MIIKDLGNAWQLVSQTDHADLSAAFARLWADRTERGPSLELATERHDDGWAVWEQAPDIDRATGRPLNFLDVSVLTHLAFYRAGIAAVSEADPYAGLLVSMHGAGIYRGRYGGQPDLKLSFADAEREQVDAFVAEQETQFEARMKACDARDDERLRDYRLLQIYDRLSLQFCVNDALDSPAGELYGLHLEPQGPGALSMYPFPFEGDEQSFTLLRRLLPKRRWAGGAEFREEFFATEPERVGIRICASVPVRI